MDTKINIQAAFSNRKAAYSLEKILMLRKLLTASVKTLQLLTIVLVGMMGMAMFMCLVA